jgi:hypothetical protein
LPFPTTGDGSSLGVVAELDGDAERRAFLARLEEPLRASFPEGKLSYGPIAPFACLCLKLELGKEGVVEVVPVSVSSGGGMGYSGERFPGSGVAHWQVQWRGEDGRQRFRAFNCQLEAIEAAIEAWTIPDLPVPELAAPPKRRQDLQSLAAAKRPAFADAEPGPAFFAQVEAAARRAGHAFFAQVEAAARRAGHAQQLATDLEELAAERIAYFFPLGPKGAQKAKVILCGYGAERGGRMLCLYVTSKRNQLELGLDQLIPGNHAWRWEAQRFRWDRRVAVPPPEVRWDLPAGDDRAARFLALMDEGRFAEGLALYAIGFDERLARRVAAQRTRGQLSPHLDEWAEELRGVLWSLAPWRFAGGLEPHHVGRIHLLSHQTGLHHTCVFLTRTERGYELSMSSTTDNDVLAKHHFARDIEQDLARFELCAPEVPSPGNTSLQRHESAAPAVAKAPSKAEARTRALQAQWEQKLVELIDTATHAYEAIQHARRRDATIVLPILLRELGSGKPGVRATALEVAGALLLPVGAEATRALDDPSLSVVREAMGALCRLRYASALPLIAAKMKVQPELRANVAWTLRSWGARPTEAFSDHLSSSDETIRAAAALSIGIYKSRKHAKALLQRLTTDTAVVAGPALRALELLEELPEKREAAVVARRDADAVRRAYEPFATVKAVG